MKLFNEIKSEPGRRVVSRSSAESGKLVKAKQPLIEDRAVEAASYLPAST